MEYIFHYFLLFHMHVILKINIKVIANVPFIIQWNTYNKPEIPDQTVCYKQEFVILEQFPMRYCSTWLRSLLCYIKKFIIEEFVMSVPLYMHAHTYNFLRSHIPGLAMQARLYAVHRHFYTEFEEGRIPPGNGTNNSDLRLVSYGSRLNQ